MEANFGAENERLPTELGWTKKAQAVTVEQVGGVSQMIAQAASLLTDGAAATKKRWVDLHAGAGF